MTNRVRNGSCYYYVPVLIDRIMPAAYAISFGQHVRVENQHGCPPCNTMNHAHVVDAATGHFLGLVHTNSLLREKEYRAELQARIAKHETK